MDKENSDEDLKDNEIYGIITEKDLIMKLLNW